MTDGSAEHTKDREARFDKLKAAADAASGQVRNLYIAFLSFGLYLAITVGATTDEQLLRESPVRLPIVDVGLPLMAFYWIAPLLFVLFHFNLLVQLYLLSEKLRWLDCDLRGLPDEPARRATLSQFVFSQMLIGEHRRPENGRSVIQFLLNVIAWTTFVVLPIAVLLLTQIQFLPYHHPYTTWWQRFLIAADLLLLWLLWLPAIEPVLVPARKVRMIARSLLAGLSAISMLMALLIATIPGEFLAGPIDRVIGERGNIGILNRNLSLQEATLVLEVPEPSLIENIGEQKALEKYMRGLDLRGRDLRYANLYRADLRKADLRDGADLRGASLVGTDLRGANLTGAALQGAHLYCDLFGPCTNLPGCVPRGCLSPGRSPRRCRSPGRGPRGCLSSGRGPRAGGSPGRGPRECPSPRRGPRRCRSPGRGPRECPSPRRSPRRCRSPGREPRGRRSPGRVPFRCCSPGRYRSPGREPARRATLAGHHRRSA